MQAFLRDELLAFCREAPPEFNDHQRDVFCVFSGTGVARLREFLNEQKAHAEANRSLTPSVGDSDLQIDVDGDSPNSESSTPVITVNVGGNHPPGATPILTGPSSGMMFANGTGWHPIMQHGPHNLSQSAPASTGTVVWANQPGPPAQPNQPVQGGAQHVTGMMGATILDDVDEGDEAFGEGSEIMGD